MLTNYQRNEHISIEKFNSFIIKVLENSNSDIKIFSYYAEFSNQINLNKIEFDENKFQKRFYWEKFSDNFSLTGFEKILSIDFNGKNRFEFIQNEIKNWQNKFISNQNEFNLNSVPLFLGGMKFNSENENELWKDFSDANWFVPKFLILNNNEKSFLVYNSLFSNKNEKDFFINELDDFLNSIEIKIPEKNKNEVKLISIKGNSKSDESIWNDQIEKILNEINIGKLKKTVLSRKVELELNEIPEVQILLDELKIKYPQCYLFSFKQNESIFFGASPEMLVKIQNGFIEADALAGSIQRGTTIEEDEFLENELLKSEKDLREHKEVIDYISNLFSKFSDEIIFDKQPKIKKLHNIQHLWTPIKIKLKNEVNIFSILENIHPTPAVCGVPLDESLKMINEIENYPRGIYAGIIGWFNLNNEGEFAVALRSALLKENRLFAFAGAGIVEGSNAKNEFKETELKLNPVLSLFKK